MVNPRLFCDKFRSRRIIPGQHVNLTAKLFQCRNRRGRVFLDGIGHRNQPQKHLVIAAGKHHGFSVRLQRLGAFLIRIRINSFFVHQLARTDIPYLSADHTRNAGPGQGRKLFSLQDGQSFLFGIAANGAGERMLRFLFDRGRSGKQIFGAKRCPYHIGHSWLTLGDCPRLIHDHGIDFMHRL